MDADREERLTAAIESVSISFERISRNVEGLYALAERAYNRSFPAPRKPKEVQVTKLQNEEEQAGELQRNAESKSTRDWLDEFGGEFVGEYEKDFLERQRKQREADAGGKEAPIQSGTAPAGS